MLSTKPGIKPRGQYVFDHLDKSATPQIWAIGRNRDRLGRKAAAQDVFLDLAHRVAWQSVHHDKPAWQFKFGQMRGGMSLQCLVIHSLAGFRHNGREDAAGSAQGGEFLVNTKTGLHRTRQPLGEDEPIRMLYTEFAVYIGIVYTYMPFMILPLYANMEKLDGSLNEAAADLGSRPANTFFKVTLPLTIPGVVAAGHNLPGMNLFLIQAGRLGCGLKTSSPYVLIKFYDSV